MKKITTIHKKHISNLQLGMLAFLLLASLAGLGYTGYRYLPSSNDTNKDSQSGTVPELSESEEQNLKLQYEAQQAASAQLESIPTDQQKSIYTGMAFKAARLRDVQAREYASKALGMMSEEELQQNENDEVIIALKVIQEGNIDLSHRVAVPFTSD